MHHDTPHCNSFTCNTLSTFSVVTIYKYSSTMCLLKLPNNRLHWTQKDYQLGKHMSGHTHSLCNKEKKRLPTHICFVNCNLLRSTVTNDWWEPDTAHVVCTSPQSLSAKCFLCSAQISSTGCVGLHNISKTIRNDSVCKQCICYFNLGLHL